MKPDATLHNPDPAYLRSLVDRSGLSQVACARLIGLDPSTFRRYLALRGSTRLQADYRTQYALEQLAR